MHAGGVAFEKAYSSLNTTTPTRDCHTVRQRVGSQFATSWRRRECATVTRESRSLGTTPPAATKQQQGSSQEMEILLV